MDINKLKNRAIEVIKKHGIPKYVKRWKPDKIKVETLDDLQKLVHSYHHHTFIAGIPRIRTDGKEEPEWHKKLGKFPIPKFTKTSNGIGHFTLHHFYGVDDTASKKIKSFIHEHLKSDLRGLILDFRYHTGGNIWPLREAFVPLLRNATLLCADKKQCKREDSNWEIMDDKGNTELGKWTGLSLPNVKIPIAIILGPYTSSSGEIAAALFTGRPGIKSFGKPTSGELSSNVDQWLSEEDKMVIYVTTSLITTVDGKCEEQLYPDVETDDPIKEAEKWILSEIKQGGYYHKYAKYKKKYLDLTRSKKYLDL